MATRRALCVGINNFKNYPGAALQGCINDANDMSALLQKYLGFTAADITKLTDVQATRKNILDSLTDMVKGARAGKYSYLVFSLSSHGTQVPDMDKDEPDHADEAFCPHDLAQKGNTWDKDHIILDDEFNKLFKQLPKNVLLEVYLDTCHSGSGLKAIDLLFDRKPRYLPPPSLEAFERAIGLKPLESYRDVAKSQSDHHILWAACRADQTSADARINNAWHGAFTYYFCQEVNASQNKLSRKQILAKVKADLKAAKFNQIPQLESNATAKGSSI